VVTLGWVQDAGSLVNLRKIIAALHASGKVPRADFLQLIQQTINVGRWADDNYARFAHALGFAQYDRTKGLFSISDLGKTLIKTRPGSSQEKSVMATGLLSSPPVVRVLDLLSDGQVHTKFEIGQKLGFGWERGFTTYPVEPLILELSTAPTGRQKNDIHSDREGTSDKYARMICGWLIAMGWARRVPKDVTVSLGRTTVTETIPQSYAITPEGLDARRRAIGVTIRRRTTKLVPYEMLCSGNQPNSEFIRLRRLAILDLLLPGRPLSLHQITERLNEKGITAAEEVVELDLRGLINSGLQIVNGHPTYTLRDNLRVERPLVVTRLKRLPSAIEDVVADVSSRRDALPEEYLNLISFSFTAKASRFFETRTYELCKHVMKFEAELLGGPVEPDVLIWYVANVPPFHPYGVIIDCKARSGGYSLPIGDRRQMRHYIEIFAPVLRAKGATTTYFLFHTSFLQGGFQSGLKQIRDWTTTPGAAISSRNMLLLADRVASGRCTPQQIEPLFDSLEEIDERLLDTVCTNPRQ